MKTRPIIISIAAACIVAGIVFCAVAKPTPKLYNPGEVILRLTSGSAMVREGLTRRCVPLEEQLFRFQEIREGSIFLKHETSGYLKRVHSESLVLKLDGSGEALLTVSPMMIYRLKVLSGPKKLSVVRV